MKILYNILDLSSAHACLVVSVKTEPEIMPYNEDSNCQLHVKEKCGYVATEKMHCICFDCMYHRKAMTLRIISLEFMKQ